ncbi:hypothetical protein C0993_006802 [Termitomyces sp. T159_Od127]|nr:hypothetical protein C0993_006802 [Termitomyces sp. T159_Od127]
MPSGCYLALFAQTDSTMRPQHQLAGKAQWNVNNVSYLPHEVPTLVKVLDSANNEPTFNITENTIILPKNTAVEAVYPPK